MTKQEFLDAMDETKEYQVEKIELGPYAICHALNKKMPKAKEKFTELFHPKKNGIEFNFYWKNGFNPSGANVGQKELENRRIMGMLFFEEMCLTYKLYKEF